MLEMRCFDTAMREEINRQKAYRAKKERRHGGSLPHQEDKRTALMVDLWLTSNSFSSFSLFWSSEEED